MVGNLHVVGAGLAGLAAAVAGVRAGWRIHLYDAAPQAGGRCRSFRCGVLDRRIDNGSHVLLGVNRHALDFATAIGGMSALSPAKSPFPLLDLGSGDYRMVSPDRLPSGVWETIRALGFPWIGPNQTVENRLGRSRSFETVWEPLCESMMNTPASQASARMFARLIWTMMAADPSAGRPWLARRGLSTAFSAPAIATLASHGAHLHMGRRLDAVDDDCLRFSDGWRVPLLPGDRIILALPPWAVSSLIPGLGPFSTQAIINGHFRLDQTVTLPGGADMMGLTGGTAQWVFCRDDVISVTVSAAGRLVDLPANQIAAQLWGDIARPLRLDPATLPRYRIVKEKRATLTHSPAMVRLRPPPQTYRPDMFLAGDWLASPWPCTMETAIRSGLAAARLATGCDDLSFQK